MSEFVNKKHKRICADMQVWVGAVLHVSVVDVANKQKKKTSLPIHPLALITVICAAGNIGREVCVFLWLNMMVAHDASVPDRPPLVECSLRGVRD